MDCGTHMVANIKLYYYHSNELYLSTTTCTHIRILFLRANIQIMSTIIIPTQLKAIVAYCSYTLFIYLMIHTLTHIVSSLLWLAAPIEYSGL